MKSARDLYDAEDEGYWADYNPMLESFGEILLKVDDDDYQGDSRVLYKDENGRFGYLMFGWGSCSGCDALQGCSNYEEVQKLMDFLLNDIRWFDTKEEGLQFLSIMIGLEIILGGEIKRNSFFLFCKQLRFYQIISKTLENLNFLDRTDCFVVYYR